MHQYIVLKNKYMICFNCFKEIKENAKFCPFCGFKQIIKAPLKKDYPLLWILFFVIGLPAILFIYINYLHSQGRCLIIGARGSTSNMTCDGVENPFTNFIYVVGIFIFLALINPIINFLSNLMRRIFKSK